MAAVDVQHPMETTYVPATRCIFQLEPNVSLESMAFFFFKWNLQKEAFHHFIMNFAVYSDGWKSIVFLNDLVTPCFMAENRKSHPQQTACCGETPPNLTIWMFPLYPGLPLSVGWTLKENRISSVETDEGGKLRAFLGPRSFMILLMQEILHQLRLVVYTIIYRGLYIPDEMVQEFFHQEYEWYWKRRREKFPGFFGHQEILVH